MLTKGLNWLSDLYKNSAAKLAAVIATIAAIGLLTVGQYGVSWDEPYGTNSVWWNIQFLRNQEPVPGIFQYDGTIFNFAAEAAFQVQKRIEKLVASESSQVQRSENVEARKRYQAKHVFTFLTTLPAYLLVGLLVGIFCGMPSAWLGAMILAFFPRFWGHSFFNFKDVPFATIFTLSILVGAYLVEQWLTNNFRTRAEINCLVRTSSIYGILIGILSGIRAGGLVVVTFPLIAYGVIRLTTNRDNIFRNGVSILYSFVLAASTSFGVAVVCYPSAWSNPIVWFYRALRALSKYSWDGKVLFQGQFFQPQTLPWHYIPTWVGISVPLIFQIMFVVGVIWSIRSFKRFSNLQQACAVLLLLQIFLLPIVSILRKSVIYGEIRHFLFIMPGIAVLTTIGLVSSYNALTRRSVKQFAIGLLAVMIIGIGLDMVALHPYQYVYFNRISGGLRQASQRFETDYWGLSLREGMEWINRQRDRHPVLVGGPLSSAAVFADPELTLYPFVEREIPRDLSKPFYYLSMYGGNRQFQHYFQECVTVHQITRQGAPLGIVRRCD